MYPHGGIYLTDAPPLAVMDAKQLLVFAGGEARALTGPETGGAQE